MSTRAGRFGPRIGGYRHKTSALADKKGTLPFNASASLFRASVHADHGHSSDLIYVVAFDEEQAEAFVRLRRDDYAQAADIRVQCMGFTWEHLDLSEAVLGFETLEETTARREYFDNRNEALAEQQFVDDVADGGSAPSGLAELMDGVYRQRREAR